MLTPYGSESRVSDRLTPLVLGHPLPPLLADLIASGKWFNPGDEIVQEAVPFLDGPVDFLPTVGSMRCESSGLLADHPRSAEFFHEMRGSMARSKVELPWLDADKAVFIATNLEQGEYLGIALDYRVSEQEPRVVASQWLPGSSGCVWRPVADTFDQFAKAIGLAA